MRQLADQGALVVTNHDEPEAVIVPVDEYQRFLALVEQAKTKDAVALDGLRRDFDQRLASLQSPTAADRLREAVGRPARLHGKVKAGPSF
jgi:PHD/YefM family antitoxin component YafN of YafNO toxin-antitoxin module